MKQLHSQLKALSNSFGKAGKALDKAEGSANLFCAIYKGIQFMKMPDQEETIRKLKEEIICLKEELKNRTNELERSNKDLEQFAYIASHDLKEPLRMVSNFIQLLEKNYSNTLDEKANEYISFALDGTKRMRSLIEDLLSYSRVQTRAKPFEETNCSEVLKKVLDSLRLSLNETNAKISHNGLPTVKADPSQIAQVFQNLIDNSLKYKSSNPPTINIIAEKKENEWLFSVSDNGIGIDMQYKDRIFLMFQRLHTQSEYPGTGIGLAICKKIIERHKGKIWVESKAGKGSTFYFTIPVNL